MPGVTTQKAHQMLMKGKDEDNNKADNQSFSFNFVVKHDWE